MRSLFLILTVFALPLAACSKKTSFDEDFAAKEKQLEADMKKLDAELKTELSKEPGETASKRQSPEPRR